MRPDEKFTTAGTRSMASRLGYLSAPKFSDEGNIPGMKGLARHIYQMGGRTQQERMIRDKRRSLDKAVLYSYQGAFVKKYFPIEDEVMEGLREQPPVRALINPDKIKQDYDDKIISIGYEHDYEPGDVFEWVGTNSYWLIYLQDKTELAYFRGEIRRCRYTINYIDEEGKTHTTYAAIRGPVETKINYIQKNGISIDRPNYSLNILLPNNKQNFDYFNRYAKFYLLQDDKKLCWRVEAIDWLSTPGILQINAVEYYSNEFEDDIKNGIAGGLIVKDEPKENISVLGRDIEGETFIKPKRKYLYSYKGLIDGEWEILPKNCPIKYNIISDNAIEITWMSTYSGQFELERGNSKKTIIVESLF